MIRSVPQTANAPATRPRQILIIFSATSPSYQAATLFTSTARLRRGLKVAGLLCLFLVVLFRSGKSFRFLAPCLAFFYVISSLAVSHKTALSSLLHRFQIV